MNSRDDTMHRAQRNVLHVGMMLVTAYVLCWTYLIGYEPAGLTMHPPPQNDRGWVHFFSHRCLVLPKFFPQTKSGFCREY